MNELTQRLVSLDWPSLYQALHRTGYALIPRCLSADQCAHAIQHYEDVNGFRKTVTMARHGFGEGSYRYWHYPLPTLVQTLRQTLYPKLVPVANQWMAQLRIDTRFPDDLDTLHQHCRDAGQCLPTPLILRYGVGGYNTLHQDLYGTVYFPLQAACFLNEPQEDYTGGEFVLTEQRPRAQSKATVLTPRRGDLLVFATNFRPMESARGYARATLRHGISEVRSGHRHALGIIFHDAVS